MGSLNPGQARIVNGTFGSDCTAETDLIKNQVLKPFVKPLMQKVDRRQLTTLLTSGALNDYGINLNVPEKFAKPRKGDVVGNSSIQFGIMGSLLLSSVVVAQQGSSNADGSFQLIMADRKLYKGQTAVFGNASYYQALVTVEPTQVQAGWLYSFKNVQGEVFVYATHAAANSTGTITVRAMHTNYGEASERGYSRSVFPDKFILDMTIQRKTVSITGDAANDVVWYEMMGANGPAKGWKYEALRQAEAVFSLENEFAKIFGISSMKNPDGTRKAVSDIIDSDTGNGITAGDGLVEQISGGNQIMGSGVNGEVTEDDIIDAFELMIQKTDSVDSKVNLVFFTGTPGWFNFQKKARRIITANNGQLFQSVKGGEDVEVGFNFTKINFGGSSMTCIVHPILDDQLTFQALGRDGKSLMGSTYFGGDIGTKNVPNMEIIAKGAYGGDRSDVMAELNGMTGLPGQVVTQKDAHTYAMLKQDMLAIYNTRSWIILKPTA